MLRSSSTAATHQAHAGSNKFARIARHVFRRTQIDVAAFNAARDSSVGLRRKWEVCNPADTFDGFQHRYRANAAIAANYVCAPFGCFERECLGAGPVQTVSVFINSRLSHDLKVRSNVPGSQERLTQLFQVTKRFQDNQVYAAFHQRSNLLPERFASFIPGSLTQRLNADSKRPNRAGHQHVSCFLEIECVG